VVRYEVALAVVALGIAGGSGGSGCGGVGDPAGGQNAPCTRTRDCNVGLSCFEGVCTEPDAGSPVDAGEDDDAPDARHDDG
jgi:hypothetical protein